MCHNQLFIPALDDEKNVSDNPLGAPDLTLCFNLTSCQVEAHKHSMGELN